MKFTEKMSQSANIENAIDLGVMNEWFWRSQAPVGVISVHMRIEDDEIVKYLIYGMCFVEIDISYLNTLSYYVNGE